ncbi:MAG: hypothetical protein WCT01_03910 [Candidatus Shapirobacteria bacterium]
MNTQELFDRGLAINQMLEMRREALMEIAANGGDGRHTRGEDYLAQIKARGIIVPAEIRYVEQMGKERMNKDLLDRVSTETGEIVTYEHALETMRQVRNNGLRVTVAFGHFDIGTKGHELALAESVRATTAWGDLFVLVGGDEVVRARKGPNRPYVPHQQRMEFVASQPGVKWVVPIMPRFRKIEDLPGCYAQIHRHLGFGRRVHFSIIGDREETISRYLDQCNEAGITLLYSEAPRITSATLEGARWNL